MRVQTVAGVADRLPDNCEIEGYEVNRARGTIVFTVRSPEFPALLDGEQVPWL
jgi:hypothetical protein